MNYTDPEGGPRPVRYAIESSGRSTRPPHPVRYYGNGTCADGSDALVPPATPSATYTVLLVMLLLIFLSMIILIVTLCKLSHVQRSLDLVLQIGLHHVP